MKNSGSFSFSKALALNRNFTPEYQSESFTDLMRDDNDDDFTVQISLDFHRNHENRMIVTEAKCAPSGSYKMTDENMEDATWEHIRLHYGPFESKCNVEIVHPKLVIA